MKRFFITLLFGITFISCQFKGPEETADIGKQAPDFALKDLDGKKISLSDYKNKVVLLEFWATWCPPCRDAVPHLTDINNKYTDKDFVILSISVDEGWDTAESLSSFAKENGITYKILVSDDITAKLYFVTTIPSTFILDREHRIVRKHFGLMSDMTRTLSGEIEALL